MGKFNFTKAIEIFSWISSVASWIIDHLTTVKKKKEKQ